MAESETKVLYRALADFSALHRKIREARADLDRLKKDETAFNSSSKKQDTSFKKAIKDRTVAQRAQRVATTSTAKAITNQTIKMVAQVTAVKTATKAIREQNRALTLNAAKLRIASRAAKAYNTAESGIGAGLPSVAKKASRKTVYKDNTADLNSEISAFEKQAAAAGKSEIAQRRLNNENHRGIGFWDALERVLRKNTVSFVDTDRSSNHLLLTLRSTFREMHRGRSVLGTLAQGSEKLQRGFTKLGNWRPRMVPPFIALVPLIGGVLAAINPLIALLGAAGGAALGFAGNLGSLAGVALALPGLFSAVAAGIAGVIVSMGGMGGVFKAYSAAQKATNSAGGGVSGGRSQEDKAFALADAEDRLAKAQRNVTKAQLSLNKARDSALDSLIKLRLEVSRSSMDEERAIANLVLAREEYNNVLADPGSTQGDKLEAAVSIKEAEADLQDIRNENIQQTKDLVKAEAKGIEGSDEVVDAKERLADSLREVRDAQRSFRDEQTGVNDAQSAAVTAGNLYQEALDKLSPSARAFVLGLIGMKDAWTDMREAVQESFFSEILDNLEDLRRLIPVIGNLLNKAAGAMGRVASRGIEMISGGPWTDDFATSAESNVVIIENLGDGALALLDALRHIVVAAAPFTEWLTQTLKEGAENFRDLVKAGRESGDLASWLDLVRSRLEKWWGIVSNISKTIFNYGSAASVFGDWISDGLLAVTEGWLAASEAAMVEDSPFKQWLEDIRPVLVELKRLFSTFFGWFAAESADTGNLASMQRILEKITDELGPALADFFDVLAETKLDEQLVEAIVSIVESITSIMEVGGSAGFSAFFDVITSFFSILDDFLNGLPDGWADGLLSVIGAIVGLAFISKFTGVTLLLGAITRLAIDAKLLAPLFIGFKMLDGLKFVALLALLKLIPTLGIGFGSVVTDPEGEPIDVRKPYTTKNFLGVEEEHPGLNLTPEQEAARDAPFPNWNKLKMDWDVAVAAATIIWTPIQSAWNVAATAASIVFVNVGLWWLGVVGMVKDTFVNVGLWWLGVVGFVRNTFVNIGLFFIGVWNNVRNWWLGVVGMVRDIWTNIRRWWSEVVNNAKTIWANVSRWWSEVVNNAKTIWTNISTWWKSVIDTAKSIWTTIQTNWNKFWGQFKNFNLGKAIGDAFAGWFGGGGTGDAPGGSAFKGVRGPAATRASMLMPSGTRITETLGNRRYDRANGVKRWAGSYHYDRKNPAMDVAGPTPLLHEFYRRLIRAGGWRQILWQTAGHYDHVHVANTGGRVPGQGNGDSVKAALTPGEFVLRKSIVSRVGSDNLKRLNSGVMSYTEMLNKAMANPANSNKSKLKGDGRDVGERPNPLFAFLNGGGLAGEAGYSNSRPTYLIPEVDFRRGETSSSSSGDAGFSVGQLIIQNPTPEPASDSLPRTIRKMAYSYSSGPTRR